MDGRTRELTTIELVVLALRQHAMNGKARAFEAYEPLEGYCSLQKGQRLILDRSAFSGSPSRDGHATIRPLGHVLSRRGCR